MTSELFVRHARKDGRSVAVLRAIDHGDSCVVETEVFPVGGTGADTVRPGPYNFASAAQADSARFDPADRHVRLLRADDTPLLTRAMDSTAGGVWARVDSGGVVYRVESWAADRLAPADSTLRPAAR